MCVLDLPSLTILPGIVATIRDEKLRMHRIITRGIFLASRFDEDDSTTRQTFSRCSLSFSGRDPRRTARPRADETFFFWLSPTDSFDSLRRFRGHSRDFSVAGIEKAQNSRF